MKRQFELFLIEEGYKEWTDSGNPSTVYDYSGRIGYVCEVERMTWQSLAEHIDELVRIYDIGGGKEALGKKSHNAVINALRAFKRFVYSTGR